VYKAIVCRLTNVRKHPNADRLMLATVQGYQVIVGLNAQEGDLGVFFPCDGMLTANHLRANKLYATDPATGDKMGGYFGKNGRVRAQKFRGEKSDGFWQEADGFTWCGGLSLKEGEEFDTLNDEKICQKYYTPETLKALYRKSNSRAAKATVVYPTFFQHYDTKQLRNNAASIPAGAVIYVSEKLHGTSGRTGHVQPVIRRGRFAAFVRRVLGREDPWVYVCGTRRTIREVKTDKAREGYYGKEQFRLIIHDAIKRSGLRKGEIVYYEIVGFTDTGQSIMAIYDITDKQVAKRYGNKMVFSYGCGVSPGEQLTRFYVYRITQQSPDGAVVDLSWDQMIARCSQLGLPAVPELDRFMHDGDVDGLLARVDAHTRGDSTLSTDHIREGVVCRVEHPEVYSNNQSLIALKYKGFHFCEMEGIKKNDDAYVDVEEIA
jgi:hypothetical protein